MRPWLLLAPAMALLLPAAGIAQQTLFACLTSTKEYFVGSQLSPSGLFSKASGEWQHLGYNHPSINALDYDPQDPSVLYIAAGNALIRAADHGRTWRFLTGSDVTELRDVVLDRKAPGTIYFAYCHGIRKSADGGVHWTELSGGLHRKYTEAIRVDRQKSGVLVVGGEEGIFRSEDDGKTWRLSGAAGFQILRLAQSPHDACDWMATTQGGGVFRSTDCAKTFENVGRIGLGQNLYGIAYDPGDARRIAIGGWGSGVLVTEDNGKTWQDRNAGLPSPHVFSIVFEPGKAGRLYAGVNEKGLFVSSDAGKTWSVDGLDGSVIGSLKFVPEAAGK